MSLTSTTIITTIIIIIIICFSSFTVTTVTALQVQIWKQPKNTDKVANCTGTPAYVSQDATGDNTFLIKPAWKCWRIERLNSNSILFIAFSDKCWLNSNKGTFMSARLTYNSCGYLATVDTSPSESEFSFSWMAGTSFVSTFIVVKMLSVVVMCLALL